LDIFRAKAASSVLLYGGRYLVRAGSIEPIEGTWKPEAMIVIEFPDLKWARAWFYSPEYASALLVRDAAISRHLILVDGIA
jgi:uncharacterized protein (DUF1330 family)